MQLEDWDNPMQTNGFAFIEFSPKVLEDMQTKLTQLGFEPTARHASHEVTLYQQGEVSFFLNAMTEGHAAEFGKTHGASVSAMGFRVKDATFAFERAVSLGAKPFEGESLYQAPAIYGIGDSLLYFIEDSEEGTAWCPQGFEWTGQAKPDVKGLGVTYLDHVTHNVHQGQMDVWAEFYERLFNFKEIRFFDIQGVHTGLISRAMTAPCRKIRIPLNEATDEQSQIEEFLTEYNGEGIQHIALGTDTIFELVESMREREVPFLTVPDTYYEQLDARVPGHNEDLVRLKKNQILVDGAPEDGEGLLLQIFTENTFGPVFFEMIQRKGNEGFGEGNFRALFVAIEEDQIRRGVLKVSETESE